MNAAPAFKRRGSTAKRLAVTETMSEDSDYKNLAQMSFTRSSFQSRAAAVLNLADAAAAALYTNQLKLSPRRQSIRQIPSGS